MSWKALGTWAVCASLLVIACVAKAEGFIGYEAGSGVLSLSAPHPRDEIVNVVDAEFGNHVGGGDLGLANRVPLEAAAGAGRGRTIRIVETVRPLTPGQAGYVRFRVVLGEVEGLYFWIESPMSEAWSVSVAAIYPDGFRRSVFGEKVPRELLNMIPAPPRSTLDIEVRPSDSPFRLNERFLFTISPVRLVRGRDFRPIPVTVERGIIRP